MNYAQTLLARALLGTGRDGNPLPPPPPLLAGVAEQNPSSIESALLCGFAVHALADRAGQLPARKVAEDHAVADDRPVCSRAASTLLSQLLGAHESAVLIEWLTACAAAGRRPSPAHLPALLDAATRWLEDRARLRQPTLAAAGPLGAFLCKANPDWLPLLEADSDQNPQQLWQTGTRQQRLALLRRLRQSDPAAARDLLLTTFASEPAGDRAAFLEALETGLSPQDEPLLESMLSDRSKEVRAAAAKLLGKLPGSAYVQRMIDRLTPLLRFTAAEPGRLLRKAKPAQLQIDLPAECDQPMQRDGIEPKPPPHARMGQRQHWLLQMISAVPPGHWTSRFGVSAAELLAAVPEDDASLLQSAWITATFNTGDALWAAALVRHNQQDQNLFMHQVLFPLLAVADRSEVIHTICRSDNPVLIGGLPLLIASGPIDDSAMQSLIQLIGASAAGAQLRQDPVVNELLRALSLAAPPELLPQFEQRWPLTAPVTDRRGYDRFFTVLRWRGAIQKEFTQ